ncbi:MmgE/PrpD family protein [Methanolacinia paynteri]|uniref:MmgE/PrpD family protein n=1 Tax=Methanolacinia paynteri TaxID=230356 RepID=UPI0009FE5625|nr:MmgE/PrpD family protein [Methanolacinia paynteri]
MMIEERLADFVSGISYESIDGADLHILKRNLLDSYAGICASLRDTVMLEKFDKLASFVPDGNGMDVWGVGRKAAVPDAVFMNTILARRSDLLDTYLSPGNMGGNHPSDNVALVLCMADWLGKSGKDLLGYTYASFILSCAFSDYYNPEPSGYDHDAQAVLYVPVIIGYILGLDKAQLTEVQRIAGVFGLDINQTAVGEVTDWKHCTYASCAMRGTHIAGMALAGFEGAKEIYEGDAGVNRFFPHSKEMLPKLPDLGSIVFKRWPALVFCQTPIDVAIDLSGEIGSPGDIDRIEVQTYGQAIRNAATEGAFNPVSRAGRTHSIPYCVAAALVMKTIEYSCFDDDFAEKETEVGSLMKKVRVVENAGMNGKYPDGAPCSITVRMNDGTTFSGNRDFPKGDPHDPLSDKELEEKARLNIACVMDDKTADGIIGRIWNIESEERIDWLVAPLKRRMTGGKGK